jgi:hypothetical protein
MRSAQRGLNHGDEFEILVKDPPSQDYEKYILKDQAVRVRNLGSKETLLVSQLAHVAALIQNSSGSGRLVP